jgi:ribosomal protein S18 acetylase RimI-like enzyme
MVELTEARSVAEMEQARALFREYADGLGVDLCFQGFEDELKTLPGKYAPPRGTLLLALRNGEPLGCVAVRPLEGETAELKRLYVRPAARGLGLGRRLTEAAIAFARGAGYRAIRLDTLAQMQAAQRLYAELGFRPIEPYRDNPLAGTAYLELALHE